MQLGSVSFMYSMCANTSSFLYSLPSWLLVNLFFLHSLLPNTSGFLNALSTAPALFSSPDNKSGQVLPCVILVELYPNNTLRHV